MGANKEFDRNYFKENLDNSSIDGYWHYLCSHQLSYFCLIIYSHDDLDESGR